MVRCFDISSSGMHCRECKDIGLLRGRYCARSLASCIPSECTSSKLCAAARWSPPVLWRRFEDGLSSILILNYSCKMLSRQDSMIDESGGWLVIWRMSAFLIQTLWNILSMWSGSFWGYSLCRLFCRKVPVLFFINFNEAEKNWLKVVSVYLVVVAWSCCRWKEAVKWVLLLFLLLLLLLVYSFKFTSAL